MPVIDALKQAQRLGLPTDALKALCEACNVQYGSILPPIGGTFHVVLNQAGL